MPPKTPHRLIREVIRDEDGNPVWVVNKLEDILTIEKARRQAKLERGYALLPKPKSPPKSPKETGK